MFRELGNNKVDFRDSAEALQREPRGPKDLKNDTGSVKFFKPFGEAPYPPLPPKFGNVRPKKEIPRKKYYIFNLYGCMKCAKVHVIIYLTRTRFPNRASFSQRQFFGAHVKLKQAK